MSINIQSVQAFIKKIFSSNSFAVFLFSLFMFYITDANLLRIDLLQFLIELIIIIGVFSILVNELISIYCNMRLKLNKLKFDLISNDYTDLKFDLSAKDDTIQIAKELTTPLINPIINKITTKKENNNV